MPAMPAPNHGRSGGRQARPSTGAAAAALLVLLAALLSIPPPARADGLADEAELYFQLGAEAYQKGDYRTALQHFLASNRLVPNRNVVYNVARSFERLGRFADAYRYYVDARVGESDARVLAELDASLARIAPEVAVLLVETSPTGATVYLERKDLGSRGRTPRLLAVAPGSYRVLVELEGHEPADAQAVVAELGKQTRVPFTLTRIVGKVMVAVTGGPRAAVRVDDEAGPVACTAPCALELPPGPHALYFAAEGYQAPARQVVVHARQTVSTTARLAILRGSVLVETDETGATIEIDDKPVGFTPAVVQGVAIGRHRLRVTKLGFWPIERAIEVASTEQTSVRDLRLEPVRQIQAASRLTEDIDRAPSSLSIVDGRELRAFGYPTVAEALRGVRGVYLSNDRSYESAGIRGIGEPNDYGNRLLVLRDGLGMNDDLINSSYVGTDARVDLYDVERIEVVRGPGSLLYGAGAMSGVVNLVPRGPDAPSQVFGGLGVWGNGVGHARTGFHYNFDRDAGVWASVGGARSGGFALPVRLIDPPAGSDGVELAHATGRFAAVGTEGRSWWGPLNAQWQFHRREQAVPVGAFGSVFDDPRTSYLDERFAGELRFEPRWESVELYTRAHANHYHFGGRYVLPDTRSLESFFGTWVGGEARLRFKLGSMLTATVGGEGQYHPVVTMRGQYADRSFAPLPGVAPYLDATRPFGFGAGYALLDFRPLDWLQANAGARVDVYSTFGPIVVPRGALLFFPVEGGVLKLMSGRAFRAPSIYEQYYGDGGVSQVAAVQGDRTLEPESIASGEIEYLQRFLEDFVAVAAAHASYVDGIINTVQDQPGVADVIRYENGKAPALTVGGEVELRREWRQGWMLAAFYGYEHAQYLSHPDPLLAESPRLVNAPEHLAGLRGVVPILRDVASIAMRAALEAPRRIDLQHTDTTGLAVIADVALSGEVHLFGLHYVVGVYNIIDWIYELPVTDTFASRTLPQNGRTFMLDLSMAYP
jgi:outer membrane receptor protein involved in Fe transport